MGAFPSELKQLYQSARWRYEMRPAVLKRDNYTCQLCSVHISPGRGNRELWLEVDHLLYPPWGSPLSAYFNQPLNQLQTICCKCHRQKTAEERANRKKSA